MFVDACEEIGLKFIVSSRKCMHQKLLSMLVAHNRSTSLNELLMLNDLQKSA